MGQDPHGKREGEVRVVRRAWLAPTITTLDAADAELSPTGGGTDGYGALGS